MLDRPPAPTGLRLRPAERVSVEADGRVLVGGDPPRLLRLSAAGGSVVRRWFAGEPVGEPPPERRLARRLLDAGIAHPEVGPVPDDLGAARVFGKTTFQKTSSNDRYKRMANYDEIVEALRCTRYAKDLLR